MSQPVNPVLDLDLYPGLFGLSIHHKVPVQHPETYTGPSGLHWGEKEQTTSAPVPLMTKNALSQYPGILAHEGNPASHVRADGNGNMSAVLTG